VILETTLDNGYETPWRKKEMLLMWTITRYSKLMRAAEGKKKIKGVKRK